MNDETNASGLGEIDSFFVVAERIERPTALTNIYDEQMRQAKITFNVGLVIGVVGFLVWLAGVAGLLFWHLPATPGAITVASGQLSNILGFFMIKFHRETNNRLDEIRRAERTRIDEMSRSEHTMRLVAQISDAGMRDKAICELVGERRTLPTPQKKRN